MKYMKYKYFNANPYGNDTNDCVIRAITIYIYLSIYKDIYSDAPICAIYRDVYLGLFNRGMKYCYMLNDERIYHKYLKEVLKLEEYKYAYKEIKVRHLPKDKTMLVNLNGHLTFVSDGILYDTFDCRNEYVESIFY